MDLFLATDHLVGQEEARRKLAVILARQLDVAEGRLSRAGGVILAGASGSGKTASARAMCRHSGLPFAEVNATRYTEAGYAGLDLQQMYLPLLESAATMIDSETKSTTVHVDVHHGEASVLKRADIDAVVERAQTGVILLDEFDKWMLRVNHVTGQKDTAIQADLLKMVEGSVEYISDNEDEVGIAFDTSRVLVICAGAFVKLYRQVAKRLHVDSEDADSYLRSDNFWRQIDPEDFERYGLLPELAGRLSTQIFTRPLLVEHMRSILEAPDSKLQEYRWRFEDADCVWAIDESAIIHLAEMASRLTTGARAVDYLLSKVFDEALFGALVAENRVKVVFAPGWPQARVEAC